MRKQDKISRSLAVALLTVSGLIMLPACRTNTKVSAEGVKLNGEIDESATPQAQTRQRAIFKLTDQFD